MSVHTNLETTRPQGSNTAFMANYLEALTLVERLHRLLLDVIKDEFERVGVIEVNAVQALLLFNIGEHEVTAGELKTRGYYQGSNVSYNLRKLVDMGALEPEEKDMERLQAASQEQDPNNTLLQAAAEEALAKAARARADVVKTGAETELTQAKTVETLSKIESAQVKDTLAVMDTLAAQQPPVTPPRPEL